MYSDFYAGSTAKDCRDFCIFVKADGPQLYSLPSSHNYICLWIMLS